MPKNYRKQKTCMNCKFSMFLMGKNQLGYYCVPIETDRLYPTNKDTLISANGICDNHEKETSENEYPMKINFSIGLAVLY